MKAERGKKQTTRGAWISDAEVQSLESGHFLILDVEGLDSRERQGEGGV
jgi:hypothetical protein